MYIAPGQGQTTHWGQNFYVNRNSLSLCPFVASLKKNLFEVWFFTVFYVCIAPGRGRQPIEDKNFMTTERPLLFAHMLQVSKWSLRNRILYTFFNYFIHVYSPEARADKPLGSKFWCQQKALTTSTICCKKISLNSDFIHIYSCFSKCIYSPRQGIKFWCQQKGLITLPICYKFQKNIFEVWFYTNIACFYTCI